MRASIGEADSACENPHKGVDPLTHMDVSWHALMWHWLTTGVALAWHWRGTGVALACPGEPRAAGDGAERRPVTSRGTIIIKGGPTIQ